MRADEVLVAMGKLDTAERFLKAAYALLGADDLSVDERAAFAMAFLMGIAYALATHNEGDIKVAARTLLCLQMEWAAEGGVLS